MEGWKGWLPLSTRVVCAYLLLFTNLSFRGMCLGVTAGLLLPEEQNKQGLCSEAATVTPCGHTSKRPAPVRALDTDLSTSLRRSEMGVTNAGTEVGRQFSREASISKGSVTAVCG